MRVNPKRSFNLCYDNRLVVLVDAFCKYLAELLAVGAENGKTNGCTDSVDRQGCSILLPRRRHHDKRYNKCRRDCERRQQDDKASHGMAGPLLRPHEAANAASLWAIWAAIMSDKGQHGNQCKR